MITTDLEIVEDSKMKMITQETPLKKKRKRKRKTKKLKREQPKKTIDKQTMKSNSAIV